MAISKQYQRFEGKLRNLQSFYQFSDLSFLYSHRKGTYHRRDNPGQSIAESLRGSSETHDQLKPTNTATEFARVYSLSRSMLNEYVIIETYSLFSDYLQNVVNALIYVTPEKFFRELRTQSTYSLTTKDIMSLGSYENIVKNIADHFYRDLESSRDDNTTLKKLVKLFELVVDENKQDELVAYLSIRHAIIHRNTRADDRFKEANEQFHITKISAKNEIKISFDVVSVFMNKTAEYLKNLDEALIAKGLLKHFSE